MVPRSESAEGIILRAERLGRQRTSLWEDHWETRRSSKAGVRARRSPAQVLAEVDALASDLADPVPGANYEALRRVELAALDATRTWARGEAAALDGKAYYQERRLRDLGLDTDWAEGEGNAWTGSRAGGGADW